MDNVMEINLSFSTLIAAFCLVLTFLLNTKGATFYPNTK